MNIKAVYKWAILAAGITLAAVLAFVLPWPRVRPECFTSRGQTVVRWKNLYYGWCSRSWNGYCLWPISRPHSTYKITVHEGTPLLNEKGQVIPVAGGKVRTWEIYDSTAWNGFENRPSRWKRFPDYEPIADNEYVVVVETRYRLFHNVEANLRLCTKKP